MPTPTTTEKTRHSYLTEAARSSIRDPWHQLHSTLMHAAFALVADKDHWKNPIDALVPWEIANVCIQSIAFMTATIAKCERVRGPNGEDLAYITAPGYYAGPAN